MAPNGSQESPGGCRGIVPGDNPEVIASRIRRRPGAALGSLALVALGLALWPRGSAAVPIAAAPADAIATSPDAAAADPTPAEPAPIERRDARPNWVERAITEATRAPQEDVPDTLGKLEGRLAWRSSGMPIEGARVTLSRLALDAVIPPEGGTPDDTEPDVSAVTDARGFFLLESVPRRESWFLRFEKEHLVEVRPVRRLPSDPFARTWQGEYRVVEQGSLSGVVVDESGTPLADVRVRAVDDPLYDHPGLPGDVALSRRGDLEYYDPRGNRMGEPLPTEVAERDALLPFPETLTDSEGRFVLRGVRQGQVELVMQGVEHAGSLSRVAVEPFVERDLGTLPLVPADRLTIEVVDPDDAPVRGVALSVRPLDLRFGPEPARTDAAGRATFAVQLPVDGAEPPAPEVAVRVQRTPGGPWESLGQATPPESTLVLQPLGRWRCRIRTPDGDPVRDVRWQSLPLLPHLRVWQRDDGEQVLSGLPPGLPVVLIASAAAHAPAVVANPHARTATADTGADDRVTELTMYPIVGAKIRVVDEGNQPVPGARVFAHVVADERFRGRAGTEWSRLGALPIGTTGADGEVEAPGLWAATTWIEVVHPEFGQRYKARLEPTEGAEIVVRVERFAAIHGALAAGFGRIDRRLRVVAFSSPFDPHGEIRQEPVSTVSTSEGFFELPRLTPGRWVLKVLEPEGRLVSRTRVQPQSVVWSQQEVVLDPNTDLHHVVLELNEPEPPAFAGVVTIGGVPRAGLRVRVVVADREGFLETETDGAGEFAFHGELRARALVQVATEHHGEWTPLATLEIPRDEHERPAANVAIDVAVGAVEIGLRDAEGQAVANRLVRLGNVDTGATLLLLSDETGEVTCDEVPEGLWHVTPVGLGADGGGIEDAIQVTAGERHRFDLQLAR